MTVEQTAPSGRYWLMLDDVPNGPFEVAQIGAKLTRGEVSWSTLVCRVGTSHWLPLDQMPEPRLREAVRLVSTFVGTKPMARALPPLPIRDKEVPHEKRALMTALPAAPIGQAWNPTAIFWCGFIFSPLWAGIMTAMNGRRLRISAPFWRPIAFGVGSLVLFLLVSSLVDSYIPGLVLYGGALILIGAGDLIRQQQTWRRFASSVRVQADWIVPILAGLPLSFLTIVVFVVIPLIPPGPHEICERFVNAKTEEEMRPYCTNNLWPALSTIAQPGPGQGHWTFEFTEEGPATDSIGGYLIGYRTVGQISGRDIRVAGLFHLVQRQGNWKVEDMYITTFNGESLPRWFKLSVDYPALAEPTVQAAPQTQPTPTASRHPDIDQQQLRVYGRPISLWLSHGGGKAVGAVIIAVIAAMCRFGKNLLALFNTDSKPVSTTS